MKIRYEPVAVCATRLILYFAPHAKEMPLAGKLAEKARMSGIKSKYPSKIAVLKKCCERQLRGLENIKE